MPHDPNSPAIPPHTHVYSRRPHPLVSFAKSTAIFAVGLIVGLAAFTILYRQSNSSPSGEAQAQTAQSLKTLHDKLDQVNTLQSSIDTLTQQVARLEQAVSLSNDLSSLTADSMSDVSSILGTESAHLNLTSLYPTAPVNPNVGGTAQPLTP